MSDLLSLPLEILIEISSYLTTPDLGALRLTCKQVERSLWDWFSKEFFAKKQFMITQQSLQALVDISHHPSLSKILQHVIISTLVYDEDKLPAPGPRAYTIDAEVDLIYKEKICAVQRQLIGLGIHRDMLVEAFKGLDRLVTIDLRDFNARRSRDQGSWNSWGSRLVYQATGRRPGEYALLSKQKQFAGQLFSTLIYALGLAGRKVPRLEVPLGNFKAYLPDESFCLSDALFPAIEHVLLNLEILHLAVAMTSSGSVASRRLRHFLNCTPNLKYLRLNFNREIQDGNVEFLVWLAALSDTAHISPQPYQATLAGPSSPRLSQLVVLELGRLDIQATTLLAVIKKFGPKLERLSLRRICLIRDSIVDRYSTDGSWEQFLTDLALVGLPSLRYFNLEHPSIMVVDRDDIFRMPVDGRGFHMTWNYVDQDLSDFFHNLGEKLTYRRLRTRSIAPPVSSDDSDISDESD